ncbi:putative ATPase [Gammaproteobacteria bacterium MOLA455]|nr:putative ATPase [Gammaproteobacteria bacterium MOLA455]
MILYYKFKNFYSFAEETLVDFRLTGKAPQNRLSHALASGQRVSKVMAVIGPNASGKTTLIKPLAFLSWFVGGSFFSRDKTILTKSHFFADSDICEFEAGFEVDEVEYRYELKVSEDQVYREALYKKQTKSFSYLFRREWNKASQQYDYSQQGFGFSKADAQRVAKHVSIISVAAQYGVDSALRLVDMADTVQHNLNKLGRKHYGPSSVFQAAEFFSRQPAYMADMSKLLNEFDLGLEEVDILEREVQQGSELVKVKIPYGVHRRENKLLSLPLTSESSGTQSAFVLLHLLLPALAEGGLAVIDEMEADLHPHMIEPIINLFLNKETNPHNAQIIFTCHAVNVLNWLNKGQVMLVEKCHEGDSEAWRLDSIDGVRADDNLLAKYNAGAYGATPNI